MWNINISGDDAAALEWEVIATAASILHGAAG